MIATHKSGLRSAFSLIELVIVVVIIGIIAAIAIPRMSRGASGAADSALIADLKVLRSAIDLYYTEHGSMPTAAGFVNQMTQYSSADGSTFSATKTTTCIYGPYLRAIPALPVGAKKGNTGVAAVDGAGVGWLYVGGAITANTTGSELDDRGIAYNTY
jgi:prepilin-type N-terminal cleavage/methylation domain-containing protein